LNLQKGSAAESIFEDAKSISVENDYVVATNVGLKDTRSGILLSSASSGASIDISGEMVGVFEMDFRSFSKNAFSEKEAYSTVETATDIINSALDLKTLTLKIRDIEDGDAFDIVIDGGSPMNYATPQASVRVNGKQVGSYLYVPYRARDVETMYANSGNTTQANDLGRYTSLYGTSFSNVAYASRTVVADKVESNIIGFNPETMQVYSKSESGETTLIWDLATGTLDGQVSDTLSVFEKYTVTLEFTNVTGGRTANLLIYSINGQSLAGETVTNLIGPNVFAYMDKNAVTSRQYVLAEPNCFDILGNATASIKVSANIDGEQISVYDKNGRATTEYTNGCYVLPHRSGTMTISYVASDAECEGAVFNSVATVFDFEPTVSYKLNSALESGEYGVGTTLTLPAATATSEYFKGEHEVFAAVYKNGAVVSGASKLSLPTSFIFDSKGNYEVRYFCEGVATVAKYEISITNDVPTFNYETEVQKTLTLGESYNIPKVTATMDGETKNTNIKLIYPDGTATANDKVNFTSAGLYTLEYSVKFNGNTYRKTHEIKVLDDYYGFTCSVPTAGTAVYGASNPSLATQTGLLLQTNSPTNTWTYNKVLDLSKSTKEDVLIAFQNGVGKFDWCYPPHIRLTDVHDSTNYIEIYMITGWHQYLQVIRAKAPGQSHKGMDWTGEVHVGGNLTSGMGTYIFFPLWGEFSPDCSYYYQGCWLSYDAEEKAIYTKSDVMDSYLRKVIDFDAEYQDVLWDGFTTGEVILSFTNCIGMLVTDVYGTNFSGGTHYDDNVAPSIYVNTGTYAESSLPYAFVGKPYRIFDVVCMDNTDANVQLDVNVYYQNGAEMNISDGVFVPKYKGLYTIQYTARDCFGNESVKTITIEAIKSDSIQAVDFELASTPATMGRIGEIYKIPEIINTSGGGGPLTQEITVTDPNGNNVEIKYGAFTPEREGEYTLTYLVKDYVGCGAPNSKEIVVKIAIAVLDRPVLSDVIMPNVILSGMDFVAPEVIAMDYKTDSNGVRADVTVSATINGEAVLVNGNVISPSITSKEENMTVVYSASNAYGTSTASYTVKVVNPGSGSGFVQNYFYATKGNIQFKATKDSIIANTKAGVEITTKESGASWQFINPLLAGEVNVKYILPDIQYNNTDKITIRLYDSENKDISISITIIKNLEDAENSIFSLNGGEPSRIAGSLLNPNALLGFTYLQESLSIIGPTGSVAGFVNKTEKGETFNGFPSGKVWLEMEFGEVTDSGVKILVQTLNNHNISDSHLDNVRPQAMLNGFIPQYISVNEPLTIPSAIAQDVLAAKTTVSIRLMKNGKVIAENNENQAFNYTFTETGVYMVVYSIKDSSGKTVSPDYSITVIENEAPMLSIGSYDKKGEVGKTYKFPTCTVTDNEDQNPTLRIFVIAPDCQMDLILPDEMTGEWSFVPEMKGKHTIRFYAYDSCFNYVVKEIVIEVN